MTESSTGRASRSSGIVRHIAGASSVEHAIILALVAVGGAGAWMLLGQNIGQQVHCVASAIASDPALHDCGAAADGTMGADREEGLGSSYMRSSDALPGSVVALSAGTGAAELDGEQAELVEGFNDASAEDRDDVLQDFIDDCDSACSAADFRLLLALEQQCAATEGCENLQDVDERLAGESNLPAFAVSALYSNIDEYEPKDQAGIADRLVEHIGHNAVPEDDREILQQIGEANDCGRFGLGCAIGSLPIASSLASLGTSLVHGDFGGALDDAGRLGTDLVSTAVFAVESSPHVRIADHLLHGDWNTLVAYSAMGPLAYALDIAGADSALDRAGALWVQCGEGVALGDLSDSGVAGSLCRAAASQAPVLGTALDAEDVAISLYLFAEDPSLENGVQLVADVAKFAPGSATVTIGGRVLKIDPAVRIARGSAVPIVRFAEDPSVRNGLIVVTAVAGSVPSHSKLRIANRWNAPIGAWRGKVIKKSIPGIETILDGYDSAREPLNDFTGLDLPSSDRAQDTALDATQNVIPN